MTCHENPRSTQRPKRPLVSYATTRIAEDMAARGWLNIDLARESGLDDRTVARFLTGQVQTAKSLKRIADTLGHSPERYIVRSPGMAS